MSTLLVNGGIFAAVLIWAICAPAAVRRIVEGAIWLFWILVGIECLSGFARLGADWPPLVAKHRWMGHFLLMLSWTIAGASVALLIRHFREHRGTAILFFLVSSALVAVTMLATLTGYLAPFAPETDRETQNRFFVLHGFAAPLVLALLVPFWIATIRCFPQDSKQGEAEEQAQEDAPPPSDNPYASPRSG